MSTELIKFIQMWPIRSASLVMSVWLGNYEDARVHYEEALAMCRHLYGADAMNSTMARTLNRLGRLSMVCGNYEVARLKYEQALATYNMCTELMLWEPAWPAHFTTLVFCSMASSNLAPKEASRLLILFFATKLYDALVTD
jgi:tetratricopeptide (TPR) repeat protein